MHVSHLMDLIGNNSCGPENWQQFIKDLHTAHKKSKLSRECVELSYASLFDVLVYPNGTFILIPPYQVRFQIPGTASSRKEPRPVREVPPTPYTPSPEPPCVFPSNACDCPRCRDR